jgi:hypothetical protein
MTGTGAAIAEELPPVSDEISELHAWALIACGSIMTTLGAVWDHAGSPLAWVSALWFLLFQVGVSLSARRARNSWLREEWFTLGVSVICMVVFGLLAHEGFVQAFAVMQRAGLATGMSASLMWWVLFAMPFLEPAGFWINAVHKEWRKVSVGKLAATNELASSPAQPPMPAPAQNAARTPIRKPAERSPKRAGGAWAPKLITGGALAAAVAQLCFRPSNPEAFERAVLAKHEHPSMSQEEIAQRAGVPRSTIGRWMREAPEVFAVQSAAA